MRISSLLHRRPSVQRLLLLLTAGLRMGPAGISAPQSTLYLTALVFRLSTSVWELVLLPTQVTHGLLRDALTRVITLSLAFLRSSVIQAGLLAAVPRPAAYRFQLTTRANACPKCTHEAIADLSRQASRYFNLQLQYMPRAQKHARKRCGKNQNG